MIIGVMVSINIIVAVSKSRSNLSCTRVESRVVFRFLVCRVCYGSNFLPYYKNTHYIILSMSMIFIKCLTLYLSSVFGVAYGMIKGGIYTD